MPPQQTNIITAVTERDAAVLRLDRSIALAKEAMDEVLTAAARLNSSTAMPRDTLLGRDAGAVAEPTQGVLGLLKRYWRAFREWRQNPRVILQDLSDRELMDIGLTRGDLYRLAPGRAIDALRDRTRYLLNHTGM